MSERNSDRLSSYETTVVTKPEATTQALKNLLDRLEKVVTNHGGEVLIREDWGKKKLAFPIKKETRGQYNYFAYTGKGDVVAEIERNIRINESTLRFASVRLQREFDRTEFDKIHWSPIKNPPPAETMERPERGDFRSERRREE